MRQPSTPDPKTIEWLKEKVELHQKHNKRLRDEIKKNRIDYENNRITYETFKTRNKQLGDKLKIYKTLHKTYESLRQQTKD